MINFDDILNSGNQDKFINQLLMSNRETMMNMIYRAIVENKMGALEANVPREQKIEGLNNLLMWFESREEYEKCGQLKNIIEKI
jgi:hypothetical protein